MHIYRDWNEDYQKVSKHSIGQGTFGRVYLVASTQNGKYYAMKEINLKQNILKCSLLNRSYALDEGLKQIKLNIDHENVIKYYRSYIHGECIYWIMDYCDGGTLRERLILYVKQSKQIEENLIWYWSLQILKGLKYLHSKGVIHRDLKPDNIYIHGKRGLCKIGDFGFAKVLVESSITQNTVTERHNDSVELEFDNSRKAKARKKAPKQLTNGSFNENDERIVYKLVNMSQVGTPSYIAPELRMLIDCHLNFSSVETINEQTKLCEKYVYKGDIFSFGCILYELTFLNIAFDNKFQLPEAVYLETSLKIDKNEVYSDELRSLIKICLEKNPEKRPTANKLFQLDFVDGRLKQDYVDYYKKQVTPSLTINTKQNILSYQSVNLEPLYKPISMKSLKFNQNLIVILAIKQNFKVKKNFKLNPLNTFTPFTHRNLNNENSLPINSSNNNISNNLYENDNYSYLNESEESNPVNSEDTPKLFIYNEYGALLREFNSYLDRADSSRKHFTFNIYDFCVDEEFNHLYLSTGKKGIMRFEIVENNHYFDDIIFDGYLDLSELNEQGSKIFPTCLTLVEDESLFKETVKKTLKRRLVFYDRMYKRIISIQVDVNKTKTVTNSSTNAGLQVIKCYVNAGQTLGQQNIRQMVSTSDEIICLFDDLNLIYVYNLKTLQLVRTNKNDASSSNSTKHADGSSNSSEVTHRSLSSASLKKQTLCLTLDSDGYLYSTNGKSIFNLDYFDFKQKRRISPFIKKGENLSHSISWMTILTNSNLVLLTDAVQMENSILFILKPISSKFIEKAKMQQNT